MNNYGDLSSNETSEEEDNGSLHFYDDNAKQDGEMDMGTSLSSEANNKVVSALDTDEDHELGSNFAHEGDDLGSCLEHDYLKLGFSLANDGDNLGFNSEQDNDEL